MAMRSSAAACLLPWLTPAPLPAQQELWQFEALLREEQFGATLAPLADVDGDGVRELVVGAPHQGGSDAGRYGTVRLLSGVSLDLLCEVRDPTPGFPSDVAGADDFDGDGRGDLLVGAAGGAVGAAFLFSSRDGALLREWKGTLATDRFGSSVVAMGDVDGDGVGDIAVGAPGLQDPTQPQQTTLHALSGRDGSLLWRFDSPSAISVAGLRGTMADAGDVDGDGVRDLAVRDLDYRVGTATANLLLLDGATGAPIWSAWFDSGNLSGYQPRHLRAIADFDGDGVGDLLLHGNYVGSDQVRAFVVSGADGGERWHADAPERGLAIEADRIGDHDGDGLPEFALSGTTWANGFLQMVTSLHRGSDGGLLKRIDGARDSLLGASLVGGLDADGDGRGDVTLGDPAAEEAQLQLGRVANHAWPAGGEVAARWGEGDSFLPGAVALLDDVDRDGSEDILVANLSYHPKARESARILSGRDGTTLEDRRVATSPDGAAVTLPDVDADGIGDYGIAFQTTSAGKARVELFSGRDGAAIGTLADPGVAGGFGEVLAVGVQPSGAVQLAVGAPRSDAGANGGGAVVVFDAATGALLFQRLGTWRGEALGSSVAYLGDMNGDGTGDWACGAPTYGPVGQKTGRVPVVSGKAGGTIATLVGAVDGDRFGDELAALGDIDGDGLDELLVSAPLGGGSQQGVVTVLGGGTWQPLASVIGAPGEWAGDELVALRDVNGDGADDWAGRFQSPDRVELRSGATGDLLARFDSTEAWASLYGFAAAPRWQPGSANGDRIADLLVHERVQRLRLLALDDLLLQVEPATAPAGATVIAALRGGPSTSACGFFLTAVNGVPTSQLLLLTVFDSSGAASISDVVPPGLSGTTVTLQGWGVGLNGRLKDSTPQLLTFE